MIEDSQNGQRRLPACERCRSRKTKCDSQLPLCANCAKAGVECMHKHKVLGKEITRSHLWSLEERIRAFEGGHASFDQQSGTGQQVPKRARLLDNQNRDTSKDKSPLPISNRSQLPSQTQLHVSPIGSDNGCSPASLNDDNESSIRDKMDSLLATTFSIGSASHVSDELDSQIRQYLSPASRQSEGEIFKDKEQASIRKLGQDFLKQARRNNTRNRLTDITAYDYHLLTRLEKRYFAWMNSAHPVLHECMFHLQLEKCKNKPQEASLIDLFQVNMVIAISLASMSRPQLSVSEIGRIAHDFWKSATKFHSRILIGRGIKKLQNILLLLQYTLLVPNAGNLWQLSGSAMRFATEMGLYAEPNPSQDFDPLSLDLRRRIFWTCYCIDRILSTVMGRPTGIPDTWISAKCPAMVEDKLITVYGIEPGPMCHLKVSQIQQIRICRLQSEIHKQLYAPSYQEELPHKELVNWSWQLYDQLRLWRSTFSHPTPLITKEWTEFQFHIAVVLLFRPSPNRPKLSDEELHVAFHSAGEGMKLVKIMHREYSAVFSWLTVQNLFMCGLTFVNSLKELAKRRNSHQLCISFVEIFLQIQSCTAMLETFSTLEEGANERIRNAFEMISSNVLQNITSIAPPLPQQSSHYGCVWFQIAKLDNISLSRPIQIEGINVPIQERSNILQQTDIQVWEDCSNGYGDEHFFEHDIDACTGKGMLNLPLDTDSYTIMKRNNPPHNLVPSDQDDHTSNDRTQPLGYQLHQEVSSSSNPMQPLSTHEDPSLERLAAISNAAAEAEPIRDIVGFPDWSESNLGAELERWFLYPLPEASEQFTL
ncbi:unnamed protein product [Debaryomyces tyrocola]|nr:unnamed protein product [Debaryomyces tyrocola]